MNKISYSIILLSVAGLFFYIGRITKEDKITERLIVAKENRETFTDSVKVKTAIEDTLINKSKAQYLDPANRKYYRKNNKERTTDQMTQSFLQHAFDISLSPDGTEDFYTVVDLYEKILKLSPNNEKAYEFYSNYLILKQEYDSVFPLLEKCLDLFPKNSLCILNTVWFSSALKTKPKYTGHFRSFQYLKTLL